MENVTITFADGLVLNAVKNANTYMVDEEFTTTDLSEVTITGDVNETLKNPQIVECAPADGKYCFLLHEATIAEQTRADVDYLLLLNE